MLQKHVFLLLATLAVVSNASIANEFEALPSIPVPIENPITPEKSILGKILFWDEQLSVDNSIACGTCHLPEFSGSDPRHAQHPGVDGLFNTQDDVFGSLGVVPRDKLGRTKSDELFKEKHQVTDRTSPSYFMGLWADEIFWDGRAGSQFLDPQSGEIIIASGAALENQALGPLMSSVEMGLPNRQWLVLIDKLTKAKPLALAADFPADIRTALLSNNSYLSLFNAAFGSSEITPSRIVMAISTYERTLVSDQSPWDIAQKDKLRLPGLQNLGWEYFQSLGCVECHKPPLFTDNEFHNIGLRKKNDDAGRMDVTEIESDRGDMKTPSLRNVALKTRFMHTGQFSSLADAFDSYADVSFPSLADKLPSGLAYDFNVTESQRSALLKFLEHSLTDPRVKENLSPFDRPKLRTETTSKHDKTQKPPAPTNLIASINSNGNTHLQWNSPDQENGVFDFEIVRSDGLHAWTTNPYWDDITNSSNQGYRYEVTARNRKFINSASTTIKTKTQHNYLNLGIILLILLTGAFYIIKTRLRRR